jgi:PilZ domain-containing protein
MEDKDGQKKARRRSARMVMRIPLLVNVVGSSPETEWEPVETIMISKHGGMLRARQSFQKGATLEIRVRNKDQFAQARVVWTSTKVTAKGMELGFEIIDEDGFWGINFPPES